MMPAAINTKSIAMNWETPPESLVLTDADVHVWRADLPGTPANPTRVRSILSPDELERADRYRFPHDGNRYALARHILRRLLGLYLNTPPDSLQFAYNDHGKPRLPADCDIEFNMSHSHALALFAFTRAGAIGVDVEYVRRKTDIKGIGERFFSPREADTLFGLPDDEQTAAFFRCWTQKEAYVKAKGLGVTMGLDTFDVSLLPGEPAQLLRTDDPDEAGAWLLAALELGPDYEAAIAVRRTDPNLRCLDWSPPDS